MIDDSYNASPAAMMQAIDMLAALPGGEPRVLAAGDMLELGSWSEDAHREVGLHAAQAGIDLIVTVGPLARDIARGAREGGLSSEHVLSFSTTGEAAEALLARLERGARVLVKGSRGMRMEDVTRLLLATSTGREGD